MHCRTNAIKAQVLRPDSQTDVRRLMRHTFMGAFIPDVYPIVRNAMSPPIDGYHMFGQFARFSCLSIQSIAPTVRVLANHPSINN